MTAENGNSSAHPFGGHHIALFSLTYAPEEVGTGPYAGDVAEHLAALGARVRVVTGMPHYPEWRVFDGYRGRWRMRECRGGVDVLRLRTYVPPTQTTLRRAGYEASFFIRGLPAAERSKPDVALAVVPSLSGGALAGMCSLRHRIPFGVIVQDLLGQGATQSGLPGGATFAGAVGRVERWVLTRASRVAVISEAFIPHLEAMGVERHRIRQVRNWSRMPAPRTPADEVRAELGWRPEQAIVLFAGNIGFKQGLEHVVEAARRAAGVHSQLRFVLMGEGSRRAALEREASGVPNVSFLGHRSGQAFVDVLRAADILLVNERPSLVDMSLPSKLTSYFVAGRPVLASVPLRGATAREIERSGGGVTVPADDPDALVQTAAALVADRRRMEELGRAGAAYAEAHLRRETALFHFDAFVADLLGDAATDR